jgi:tetrahydromethanopterin S-methyltransferase subunit B
LIAEEALNLMNKRIILLDTGIRITELEVPRKDIADFLRSVPEADVETTLIQAMEVGVFCLERARMSQDTEFVRRQIDMLLNHVEMTVKKIPDDTQRALVDKIGTNNGQILAPLREMIDAATKLTADKVKEVRTLLTQEIDPAKETTTLGKALKTLRDVLDPKRNDSVQSLLEQAVKTVTGKDGALARAVKEVVAEAVNPLATEVDKLTKEIRGQDAAAEALEQTTLKGTPYEEEVTGILQVWARAAGAEVHHVGVDNQPGDVVITVRGDGLIADPISIVVEVRDRGSRAMGRKAISADMASKLAERGANAGIYLSRTQDGLSLREIGEWAEGISDRGLWVACTQQHLITAVRFLIVQRRLAALRAAAPEVDSGSIEQQVKAIRTSLGRIRTIKTKLTELGACSDVIDEQADHLREEIKEALSSIEDSMRAANCKKPPLGSVTLAAEAVATN